MLSASLDSTIDLRVDGLSRIIFDKRELKAAIRKGGAVVRVESRRLIASRAISSAGGLPGRISGIMQRSIKTKVGSGGGYAKVQPTMTSEMRADTRSQKYPNGAFYPAFLILGTRRGLRPRKDFMVQALTNKNFEIRAAIRLSLRNALTAGVNRL